MLRALLLAAPVLVLTAGCGKRGGPRTEQVAASATASPSGKPPVVNCYDGCLELNKGKPVDPSELAKNCKHKCVRICAKGCAVERGGITDENMAACSATCEATLGR